MACRAAAVWLLPLLGVAEAPFTADFDVVWEKRGLHSCTDEVLRAALRLTPPPVGSRRSVGGVGRALP